MHVSSGFVFRVPGLAQSTDISRVLDQRMLKSAARAEKRAALLASVSNCRQCAIRICVRAGGHAPDSIELLKLSPRVMNGRGVNPDNFRCDPTMHCREAQRFGNCLMSNNRGIEISNERNPAGAGHFRIIVFRR